MENFIKIQQFIFQTLANNDLLKEVAVFNQVPKNTSFPYIFLGKFYISDKSTKDIARFFSVYEVHLYSRNTSVEKILFWITEIKKTLSVRDVSLKNVHITEVGFMETAIDIMSDGKTHRAITKFRINAGETYARI